MKWSFVIAALAAFTLQGTPADACGIRLITPKVPRKVVARSSNPTPMLLVGSPARVLERELTEAGHTVEVARDVNAAKNPSYRVVVTDSAHADEVRAKFPSALVVVRTGDVSSDIASIESQITRKPIQVAEARRPVQVKPDRQPGNAGPAPHTLMTAMPSDTSDAIDQVAVVDQPTIQTSNPVAVESHAAKATPVKQVTLRGELFFGLGRYGVDNNQETLARAVRWLNANPDAQITVEGFADPTGNHDANMVLSQKRAEAVRDALVAAGIASSRFEIAAFGDTHLKYGQADGRNRRVVLTVKH